MKLKIHEPSTPDQNLLRSLEHEAMLNHGPAMAAVDDFHRKLERDCQIPILIEQDADIPIPTALVSAWMVNPRPPVHLIQLAPQTDYYKPHALAHQLVHLRRQWESLQGTGLFTPCINIDQLLDCSGVSPRRRDIDRRTDEAKEVSNYLYDTILDVLAEARLVKEFPRLSAAQHHWALRQEHSRAQTVYELHMPDSGANPAMRRTITAVSGAAALSWDHLISGASFADYYRAFPEREMSEKIFVACQRFLSSNEPGWGHSLVSEVASIVRLPKVYTWNLVLTTPFPRVNPDLN